MYDGEDWSKMWWSYSQRGRFHSKTEDNLESIKSIELISKMKETVLESLAKFKRQGSIWRFSSLLSLYLHTVKYEPLGPSSYIPLSDFSQQIKRLSWYDAIKIEFPEKGSKISSKNHNRSMQVQFIVYADCESFTWQLSTCQTNPEKSYNKQY